MVFSPFLKDLRSASLHRKLQRTRTLRLKDRLWPPEAEGPETPNTEDAWLLGPEVLVVLGAESSSDTSSSSSRHDRTSARPVASFSLRSSRGRRRPWFLLHPLDTYVSLSVYSMSTAPASAQRGKAVIERSGMDLPKYLLQA